jgi:histidyl-tRNA synthetase
MFVVRINNRRFFNDVVAKICDFEGEAARLVSKVIDRREKVSPEDYVKSLKELGLDDAKIEKLDSLYSMTVDEATAICPESEGSQELKKLFEALRELDLDKYCIFDFGIIRGLDYYTGTVFEVFDKHPENTRAMFGGGRYDNLVGLFAKNAHLPGVGFGCGDVTLQNFLESHNLIPEEYAKKTKVLITRFDDVPFVKYSELSATLRESGIISSVYIGTKKFGKQIDFASKEHYSHVVIMGGSEFEAGVVKVKDLDAHEETTVKLGELVEYFNK